MISPGFLRCSHVSHHENRYSMRPLAAPRWQFGNLERERDSGFCPGSTSDVSLTLAHCVVQRAGSNLAPHRVLSRRTC